MARINDRIKKILENLEQINEDLLALSDDIWLSIDHNDNVTMEEGVKIKSSYNQELREFNRLSDNISDLLEEFTGTKPSLIEAETASDGENERIIKELDKKEKHYLSEDFTYKRPYGFNFNGKAYKDVTVWKRLYVLFLNYLSQHESDFKKVIFDSRFVSKKGHKSFSKDEKELRSPLKITEDIFAETNLSANDITDRMIEVLSAFGYKEEDFVVYLREDRDFKSSK